MSERLRQHGALPFEVPTIAVEPPRTPAQMERAIKGLVTGRYEWIVFTSTNAVRAIREKFTEFGLDARAFAGVKIACVGEATAGAVRSFGIEPELLPAGEQSSDGLLEVFPPYDAVLDPIDRVLLPRAGAGGRARGVRWATPGQRPDGAAVPEVQIEGPRRPLSPCPAGRVPSAQTRQPRPVSPDPPVVSGEEVVPPAAA